jgi:poly(beta-D-mannuronate) lyase
VTTGASAANAKDTTVASPEQFATAIVAAGPGDTIRIADGRYSGWRLSVPPTVAGAANARIRIVPQSEHGVTFTGPTTVVIRGDYIELADFRFEGTGKNSVTVRGHHNRISGLVFRDAGDKDSPFPGILVVEPGAIGNEIDHCQFIGSLSMSIKIRMRRGKPAPVDTHIHHNLFQDIVRRAKNGQEPIQLGQDRNADVPLHALVEYNQFLRVNGDPELISNKSSENVIRYNLVIDSDGEIVLRTGRNCIVEGNIFIDSRGGVRVSGSGHRIVNNFVKTATGRGIVLTDGTRRYRVATGNLIAHNTVISDGRGIFFATFDPEVMEPAAGNRFVNNILVGISARPVIAARKSEVLPERLAQNSFEGNLMWQEQVAPEGAPLALGDGFIIANPRIEVTDDNIPSLLAGSPAIDAGLAGVAGTDIRGRPRPSGAGADIGAFEAP